MNWACLLQASLSVDPLKLCISLWEWSQMLDGGSLFFGGISDFLEVKTQTYNLKDTWLWCSVIREWSVLCIISISSSWFSAELSVRSLRSSVGQICFLIVCPFCGHSELNCWLRAWDFLKWIVVDFIGCCPLCAGLCIGPFIYIVLCTHGSPH